MKTTEVKPEVQHTPTPWKVSVHVDGCNFTSYMINEVELAGAESDEEAEANAAFIVRAVNAHEELLRVAKFLITLDDDCGREHRRINGLLSDARLMVEQAIARAEGK